MIITEFRGTVLRSNGVPVYAPIQVTLSWDPDIDPLAVQMVLRFEGSPDEIVWHFSRQLMVDGLGSNDVVGPGDVRFRYSGPRDGGSGSLIVCLKPPTGHADIRLPFLSVKAFLDETRGIQQLGEECIAELLDEAIEEILSA